MDAELEALADNVAVLSYVIVAVMAAGWALVVSGWVGDEE